jgi:transmembrane sensor
MLPEVARKGRREPLVPETWAESAHGSTNIVDFITTNVGNEVQAVWRRMIRARQSDAERNRCAAEQAALWLERLERTLKDGESALLREWLEVALHRELILERCRLWHGPEILAVLAQVIVVDIPAARDRRHYGRLALAIFLAGWGLAASTMLIAASRLWTETGTASNPWRAEETYRTPAGARIEVKLPDGGTMTLNTATHVLVSYGPHARDVTLIRGEASFDVIEDAARPFRLSAGARRFEVASQGAHFNLSRQTMENAELTVIEGQVKALASGTRAPMTPAQLRARLDHGERTFSQFEGGIIGPGWYSARALSSTEVQQRLAWRNGLSAVQ